MRGRSVKLCRGGGQLVAHSRDRPKPHGSSTVHGTIMLLLYTTPIRLEVVLDTAAELTEPLSGH
jgi:hypothetical protein